MNRRRIPAGVILFSLLILPTIAAAADKKAAKDQDTAIGEKWVAAWNSHDADKMLPLFTDDIVYEDVAFAEVNHGKAELRKFVIAEVEGVPDLQLKLERA